MKRCSLGFSLCALVSLLSLSARAESDIPAFYGDPPDAHHPWAVHDRNRPQPEVVTPGTFSSQEQPGTPPSDAVILFNGTDDANWVSAKDGSAAKWQVKDGLLVVEPKTGDIQTKQQFGDCQLHVEWSEMPDVQGSSQGRGNSGIFLMGRVEIQVLDCYHNVTYADGSAGSVYGQHAPMANALRPPGQFQFYDILFRRPIYKEGKEIAPGYVTVFVNGVAVQDHAQIEGPTGHMKRAEACPFPETGPLVLQDHGNRVRYRNIWYRPLPPRAIEGGTDGYLSTEATMAKRRELAAGIRADAAHLQDPLAQLERLMESLVYEAPKDTVRQVNQQAEQYLQSLRPLSSDQLSGKKDQVKQLYQDFDYLVRFRILPAGEKPKQELHKLIKEQHWDKK